MLASAVISQWELRRVSVIGTRTAPAAVLPTDTNEPAATSTIAIAHTVQPTLIAGAIRRVGFPATIGSGIVWTFGPNGLLLPASLGLALVNIVAGGVADVTAILEE